MRDRRSGRRLCQKKGTRWERSFRCNIISVVLVTDCVESDKGSGFRVSASRQATSDIELPAGQEQGPLRKQLQPLLHVIFVPITVLSEGTPEAPGSLDGHTERDMSTTFRARSVILRREALAVAQVF